MDKLTNKATNKTVRIPLYVLERLKKHAKLQNRTVADVAVQAIMAYDFNIMCNAMERQTQYSEGKK